MSPTGLVTYFAIPTEDSDPVGITAGPDGHVWFAALAGTIGRVAMDGTITEFRVPTDLSRPLDITSGPDGNLWFTEPGANKVGRINPATGAITEFDIPTAGSEAAGITAGPDGNVWFVEELGNRVGRITPTGAVTEFALPTPDSRPRGITAGPDGNLWFTETSGNRIGRITPGGAITEFPIPTRDSAPWGIVSESGVLWFTAWNGNRIGRIFTNGAISELVIWRTVGQLPDITADSDGRLWFTDYESNLVSRIDQDDALTRLAPPGAERLARNLEPPTESLAEGAAEAAERAGPGLADRLQPGPTSTPWAPDLRITGVQIRGNQPDQASDCDPGENRIEAMIKNDGGPIAQHVLARLEVDGQTRDTQEMPALGPQGDEQTVRFRVNLEAGRRALKVTVDPEGQIAESREDNNVWQGQVSCVKEG